MDTTATTTRAEEAAEQPSQHLDQRRRQHLAVSRARAEAFRQARRQLPATLEDYRRTLDRLDVLYREDARTWGDYMMEYAARDILRQIDGLGYYVRMAIGSAVSAAMLLGDLRQRAGEEATDTKVRWENPLGKALWRLQWVRDHCVPKDTTSRAQLGAELDAAIAHLEAVTNPHAWAQPHKATGDEVLA